MTALAAVPDNFHDLGWRLSAAIPFWIAVACVPLIVAGVVLAWARRDNRYEEGLMWTGVWTAGLSLLTLLIVGVPMLIWAGVQGTDYMKDYRVEGNVLKVSNVLDEASGDLTRMPVVTLDTVDRPLVVDDPRVVNLQGADVVLKCSLEWHYRETDTYLCKIMEYVQ